MLLLLDLPSDLLQLIVDEVFSCFEDIFAAAVTHKTLKELSRTAYLREATAYMLKSCSTSIEGLSVIMTMFPHIPFGYSITREGNRTFTPAELEVLGTAHTLNLSHCSAVSDVSGLGGVHTLNLAWCSAITNVSGLGGVHTLNISYCHGITDVSALGGVHTLDLSHC